MKDKLPWTIAGILIIILIIFESDILTEEPEVTKEITKKTPHFDLDEIRERSMIELERLPLSVSVVGATVELDQRVYTWTDKIYITIVAPTYNFDSNAIEQIGNNNKTRITISTSDHILEKYSFNETGSGTGIFTGEIILTGFMHDADGDSQTGTDGIDTEPKTSPLIGGGATDGLLESNEDDLITVMFMTDAYTVTTISQIRWNEGEVQWLEASYPTNGEAVIGVVDPDMNIHPEKINSFGIKVWSERDPVGIIVDVIETNEATGIFEGTVFFTKLDESYENALAVHVGNTIFAQYVDNTLPNRVGESLEINGTAIIVKSQPLKIIPVEFRS